MKKLLLVIPFLFLFCSCIQESKFKYDHKTIMVAYRAGYYSGITSQIVCNDSVDYVKCSDRQFQEDSLRMESLTTH